MMKTKILLALLLIMGFCSFSSFSADKLAKQQQVLHKQTIIEFGDYYHNGDWFYVFGDPTTGEITHIIPFGIVSGSDVASWSGSCYYAGGAWYGDFTVTPVVGSAYYIGVELLFA